MLPDGNVTVSAAGGGRTTYTREGNGEFESPSGDSALKVEAKESPVHAGTISEYVVRDSTAGTTTKFTQPEGTESAAPLFASQFGNDDAPAQAAESDAIDAHGNLWDTDYVNNRVQEFSPAGALLESFGAGNPGRRQFNGPWGIAVNTTTGNIYVTDQGNNRVEELSPEGVFIAAWGWGVSNGKDEFELCTSGCGAGIAGSGPGQFSDEAGIAVDASGNVWVADYGNNRIEEFSSEGHYLQQIGSPAGGVQFGGPLNIAPVGQDLYVVDYAGDEVKEVSNTGKLERQFGQQGTGNGDFSRPRGIAADPRNGDLYVTDAGNNRVEEFSPTGGFITKFGATGSAAGQLSEPTGVAVNATGGIYVTDYNNDRIEEWIRGLWLATADEGTLTSGTSTQSYGPVETGEGATIVAPTEASAPAPVGVTCGPKPSELEKGCRALLFKYGTSTTAGEKPSEWGEYRGRLKAVLFAAYKPSGEKVEEPVADYAYDHQGRLRAQWDPRIKPELKTIYGYDREGHVTALTDPGQESWTFTYGAIAGDASTGRLLKVTQAPATSSLWNGDPVENTGTPQVSGSPEVGVKLGVSSGAWSNSPVSYAYQWEDCKGEAGKEGRGECAPIPGATNANYTVQASDIGLHLAATVTATNGDGSVSVASGITRAAESNKGGTTEGTQYTPGPGWTLEYNVPVSGSGAPNALGKQEVEAWGQKDDPESATAIIEPAEAAGWPATSYEHAHIVYLDEEGRTVNVAAPGRGVGTTEYNGVNEVTRTLSAENRETALKSGSTTEARAKAAEALDTKDAYSASGLLVETLGPEHPVMLAHGKKKPREPVLARAHTVYYHDEGAPEGDSYGLVTKKVEFAQTATGEQFDTRTTTTSYSGQGGLGWKLRKPTAVTIAPGGLSLTTTTRYDPTTGNPVEVIPPGSASAMLPLYASEFGSPGGNAGDMSDASAITRDPYGDFWVADAGNNRIDEFSPTGTFMLAFGWGVNLGKERLEVCVLECRAGIGGSAGAKKGELSAPRGIAYDPVTNDLYVANTGDDDISQFTTAGKYVKTYGKKGDGKNEYDEPEGLTTAANGDLWVADRANRRLVEITDKGKSVAVAGVSKGEYADVTVCKGKLYASDSAGQHIDEIGTEGTEVVLNSFGSAGSENGEFTQIAGLACDPQNGDIYATDSGDARVEVFTGGGVSVGTLGTKGTEAGDLTAPSGIALDAAGTVYILDSTNDRIEEWEQGTNGPGTHGVRSAYYSAAGESTVAACRNHREWADLLCQTEPISQPGAPRIPNLPVTSYTYNVWDEVESSIERFPAHEAFAAVTREKVQHYDAAGRAVTSETLAEPATDAELPKVTRGYNSQTGALTTQSTTSNGTTKTITSVYNAVGELTSYTDAAGVTTEYKYEEGGDRRLIHLADGHGEQSYSYNTTTGLLEKLVDSAAGTFTATYDLEGHLTAETYPNELTAKYTYNSLGGATKIEYVKTGNCAKKCPETWFSDASVLSVHGEMLEQLSTLSTEHYQYDEAGRPVETQETPAGGDCVTRLYGYDEESDRTSETTREPHTAPCAAEGGVTETHVYDAYGRLDDAGIAYESFGNVTKMPGTDAGGEHEITASYYVDGQTASQTQAGETVSYQYDPEGRTEKTVATGKTEGDAVLNYAGSGEAISWINEGNGKWTRDIAGIGGTLAGTETAAGAVTLYLHDLHGDVVATVADSPTETKFSTYDSTEFGVPNEGRTPPSYAWLGAIGVTSEEGFESGAIIAGGASYVPQVARDLQTAPVVPPGAFPFGDGGGSPYTSSISSAELASAAGEAEQAYAEAEAARQAAARRAACEAAPWTCVTVVEDPLLTFTLNRINSFEVYELAVETYETESHFTGFIALLITLGGWEGKIGILSSLEVQDAEFGAAVIKEWLWQLAHGLENCVVENRETQYGGNKGCKFEFYAQVLEGDEDLTDRVLEPTWEKLPAIWWCQYEICYPQNHGLVENEVHNG